MVRNLLSGLFTAILAFTFLELHSAIAQESEMPTVESGDQSYRLLCAQDIEALNHQLERNSAAFANKADHYFHEWHELASKELPIMLEKVKSATECYHLLKYYINGYKHANIRIKPHMDAEQKILYPGFLIEKRADNRYYVIYNVDKKLQEQQINIGDEITHVNGVRIDEYYKQYIAPFYAQDTNHERQAAIYITLDDENIFRPIIKTVTITKSASEHGDKEENKTLDIELEYRILNDTAYSLIERTKDAATEGKMSIEPVSNGVWIKIPSFAPEKYEAVHFSNMLSRLKNDYANQDYIIFDLRGNLGGFDRWYIPIMRNLWGDDYLKSLKDAHDYNMPWKQILRVSGNNFEFFKRQYNLRSNKQYIRALKNKDNFLEQDFSPFDEKDNLYTHQDSKNFRAKIYILTDNICYSTCFNFAKEITQIPGVIHIGSNISPQTPYSGVKKSMLPSGFFEVAYPTQLRTLPKMDLGDHLIASIKYPHNWQDETTLIEWVVLTAELEAQRQE